MRAYYIETPLTDAELQDVAEMMETEVEQVRVPYVLPAPDQHGGHPERPLMDDELAMKPLKAAGILRDSGSQILLVIPLDGHWYTAFSEAIARLTGHYPYLVQTEGHRTAIGNPGGLRILDMEGLMRRKG
jgi:hypothetical protein